MSAKYWQRGETIDYTATDDLAVGQALYWDAAAENITTAAGSSPANTPAGWAVAAAGSSDATVLVKLLG